MENSWNGWRWSLWELLVIGDTESQLDTSCKQVRPPVKGVGYIQLSCWPRGSSRNSQTAQAFGKQILLSANWQWAPIAEDDSGVPVLKATPTQVFWPWRSWTAAYMEPSLLCFRLFGVGRYLQSTARESWTPIQPQKCHKTLAYNVSCLKMMLGQWLHITCWSNSPMSDLI